MITLDAFMGGAERRTVSADVTLSRAAKRVQELNVTSAGKKLNLPAPADLQPGGPWFYLHNVGTQSISVQSTPNVSVGPNEVGLVLLAIDGGAKTWKCYSRAENTPQAFSIEPSSSGFSSRDMIAARPAPPTYSDDCSETCDPTASVAARVPMFMNSASVATNVLRDPIRGADLLIQPKIKISVSDGMVIDSTHPSGVTPSGEVLDLLVADHILEFDSVTSYGGASRNPYHVGLHVTEPTYAWRHPAESGTLTVSRKVWKKTISYHPTGLGQKTLELRFVAEWIVDDHKGLWGTLFSFYAFCDEVAYTPGAADSHQNSATFTRDDPIVYPPLFPTGGNTHKKFFHPQLLMAASIPTTFHASAGTVPVPAGDELWPACYARQCGAPWSAGVANDAYRNCVFARPDGIDATGLTDARAMTVGGDAPTSELYPYLCIENGAGYGGTLLKPTHAGWDESLGDITAGSDASILDCAFPQDSAAIDVCDGHPSDVYGGVGGTHRCFKVSDHAQYSCVPPSPAHLIVNQACCKFETTWGEPDGFGACTSQGTRCSVGRYFQTTLTMQVQDYDFSRLDATLRKMTWIAFGSDPTYVPAAFVDTSYADTSESSTTIGTWNRGPTTFKCTAVAGSAFLRGAVLWQPAGFTCSHVKVTVVLKTGSAAVPHVVCARWLSDTDGYAFEFVPTTGALNIWKVISGTATLLATVTGPTTSADATATVLLEGTRLQFTVGTATVQADDCKFKYQGGVAFGTRGSTTGAEFQVVGIEDRTAYYPNAGSFVGSIMQSTYVELRAGVTEQELQLFKNAAVYAAASSDCSGGEDPLCGTVVGGEQRCGCTQVTYGACTSDTSISNPSTSSIDYINVIGAGNPHPERCDGSAGLLPCDTCPPPYMDSRVILPAGCKDVGDSTWPYSAGAEWWAYETKVEA